VRAAAALLLALSAGPQGATPVAVVVLFDMSASMSTSGGSFGISSAGGHHARWAGEVEDALKHIAPQIGPSVEIATGTFANDILIAQGFRTSAADALTDFRWQVQLGGRSPVADAVWVALDRLESRNPKGVRAIVVITDGFNGGNWKSLAEVQSRAVANNVHVFTVLRPSGLHADIKNDRARDLFRELAEGTKASHLDCQHATRGGTTCGEKQDHLGRVLQSILVRLRSATQ
jgi:hypothetical protein